MQTNLSVCRKRIAGIYGTEYYTVNKEIVVAYNIEISAAYTSKLHTFKIKTA